ncbi:MAG: pantoate--beta-alanine ligase [Acidimicrobiia bacterium]|nr:pantoate--beta-alanine ligase [Acidimicrobiia bacterium]
MEIVATFAEARGRNGRIGLVPTMGFLHEGHVSLIEAARSECDVVIMTLFVNPLQFEERVDLDRYPRDLERDAAIAESAGVDVIVAPSVEEMYPVWPPATVVQVPGLADIMEGAHRPGHFDGVATVVAKLFAGAQANRAYFGRKDAQQLAVVRAMARDLSFPIEVRGMPILRESDGLALSSRNVFLEPDRRAAALSLNMGLMAAADAVEAGERDAKQVASLAWDRMDQTPGVEPEYAEVASQDDVVSQDSLNEPTFLAVAARVGDVRLIDNVHFDVIDGEVVADRGTRLQHQSILYEGGH